MIARHSQPTPDPAQRLLPETADALLAAFRVQRGAGVEPTPELRKAVHRAATDARDRSLRPELVLGQLNEIVAEASLDQTGHGPTPNRGVREWLVVACLRAYWDETK